MSNSLMRQVPVGVDNVGGMGVASQTIRPPMTSTEPCGRLLDDNIKRKELAIRVWLLVCPRGDVMGKMSED